MCWMVWKCLKLKSEWLCDAWLAPRGSLLTASVQSLKPEIVPVPLSPGSDSGKPWKTCSNPLQMLPAVPAVCTFCLPFVPLRGTCQSESKDSLVWNIMTKPLWNLSDEADLPPRCCPSSASWGLFGSLWISLDHCSHEFTFSKTHLEL